MESLTKMYLRLLCVLALSFACVAPAYAQSNASLGGVVVDAQGAPVAGATVSVLPASAKPVTTDAGGHFTFTSLPSGAYVVTARKAGYISGERAGVTVPAASELTIALQPETLSTLKQIATVQTSAGAAFNTSASAIVDVSQSAFVDQGQLQMGHVLDQIPGVVAARGGTFNAAVPGSLVSPNMRGALDYEKATLVDGHPLINGGRGDYPIQFVNSLLFDGVEIVKGPTAYAPEIDYGIGGTMNFRTGEPSYHPGGNMVFGADSQSGYVGALHFSNTVGKFGYLVSLVSYGTQGPLDNTPLYVTLPNGSLVNGQKIFGTVTSSKPINGVGPGPFPVAGAFTNPSNAYTSLVACCQTVNSNYLMHGEVLKGRYQFSPATELTAGYIGIQGDYDAPAGSLTQIDSVFAPTVAYGASGPLVRGSTFLLNNGTTIPDQTTRDNEPMFEAELRTTRGNDTILARYYSAMLLRQTNSDWTNPTASDVTNLSLYGTVTLGAANAAPTLFTGQSVPVTIPVANAYANSVSDHDYLHGVSFQYDHPMGNDLLTLAFDRNTSLTNSYSISPGATPSVSTSIAAGTRQDFTTWLLRDVLQLNDKTQVTLANYYNVYQSHYTPTTSQGVFGFGSSTQTHDDPRLGIAYRAGSNLALRFSAGSSIAPPYPSLIDTPNQSPGPTTFNNGCGCYIVNQNAGTIKPETSFGYDLGGDYRLKTGDILSFDLYSTVLRNQFVGAVYQTGVFSGSPVYAKTNANLANAMFDGIETSIRRAPSAGFGYVASASLQRAYAFGIDPSFYATNTGAYTTNLGVVPGLNYIGFGNGWNGVSNKSEAYSMGYAEVNYRAHEGQFARFGLTYYGSNNTYNEPAFFVASATYSQPITKNLSVQLTGDNLFNVDSASWAQLGAAVPAPLVNGQVGLRNIVPYGPATYRLLFVRAF